MLILFIYISCHSHETNKIISLVNNFQNVHLSICLWSFSERVFVRFPLPSHKSILLLPRHILQLHVLLHQQMQLRMRLQNSPLTIPIKRPIEKLPILKILISILQLDRLDLGRGDSLRSQILFDLLHEIALYNYSSTFSLRSSTNCWNSCSFHLLNKTLSPRIGAFLFYFCL